ncbi:hypothetical protein BHM03_00000801 [Ensete ventricosum]|nr:hypothetical protein BHM03_00000801 [Ensete ventricosum]
MSLYSESNGVSVPESLIFFIAYHTAASHHVVRGPCDEVRACRFVDNNVLSSGTYPIREKGTEELEQC